MANNQSEIVGKGRSKGPYTDIGGIGKFERCTGGGTWESESLAREMSHITSEGERKYK